MVFRRIGIGTLVVAFVVGVMIPSTSSQQAEEPQNLVFRHSLHIAQGTEVPDPQEQELSGGVVDTVLHAQGLEGGGGPARAQGVTAPPTVTRRTNGCANIFGGRFTNVRVNRDCSFRRQAEEQIVIDPTDPNHLIAGQNDSRIGFNHCGIDFSFDRGRTWGDMLPPFWQFILLDGHTADAGSDPALAFDSRGNAYFSCIIFDVNSAANAVVVTKSNAAFGGTFFHTPQPGPNQAFLTTPLGVAANDNDPTITHDKEFIAADAGASSPKRDRVYVTWTRFLTTPMGQTIESPIYFSESKNGGATWSPGIEISGANTALCVSLASHRCNRDQGSWPLVGPDGTLYVFFNNRNTSTIVAQQMMVKCLGTADCTKATNWSTPVFVADDFRTQPFYLGPAASDPVTGCPRGRQCLPPNGYRLNDFGAGALDPRTGRLYFAWSDFRNGGPCATMNGLPVEPCANHHNDVFIVRSDDGGATWSKPTLVSNDGSTAAHWQAWMAVGPDGTVFVAYYDRHHGGCEATGCNDITVAIARGGEDAQGNDDEDGGLAFRHVRITTGSMPNLTLANNPAQAGFLGDYMSIAADTGGAVLVWADTRSALTPVPEEDVYFATVPK